MSEHFLTDDTKATLLLCGVFSGDRSIKALSQAKYHTLARCLAREHMRPSDLLDTNNVAQVARGSGLDTEHLQALLSRGAQLGFAVEEWERNGIWLLSRSDEDYPQRYKQHLKDQAPPLLYGIGDRSLMHRGGLAVVGSRNVDADGEAFTHNVGRLCASQQVPVISGGARGVDQTAMQGALSAGGVSVGVLAENLLKKSLEKSSRSAIAEKRLLLISHCHPTARFTVGTAMARNKLIYALADHALVVSCEHKKGGTWAGAEEELRRPLPVPVFVRQGNDAPQGNNELLALGAQAWSEEGGVRESGVR